jgi:hypothetical protein
MLTRDLSHGNSIESNFLKFNSKRFDKSPRDGSGAIQAARKPNWDLRLGKKGGKYNRVSTEPKRAPWVLK